MLTEALIIFVAVCLTYFVSTRCCIYTAIAAYSILSALGFSPIYCVGWVHEVDGKNWYHAWVRVGSRNIEQSMLNMSHYVAVDYTAPVLTFDSTAGFIDRMDMWSPIIPYRQWVFHLSKPLSTIKTNSILRKGRRT